MAGRGVLEAACGLTCKPVQLVKVLYQPRDRCSWRRFEPRHCSLASTSVETTLDTGWTAHATSAPDQ
jgi:hypothetical protein